MNSCPVFLMNKGALVFAKWYDYRNSKYFRFDIAYVLPYLTPDPSVNQLINKVLHGLYLVCLMSETPQLGSAVGPLDQNWETLYCILTNTLAK